MKAEFESAFDDMENPKARSLTGLRVLVVEDEPMLLMVLEDILGDLGCEIVATAGSLEAAIGPARSTVADIAVLDVSLGKDPVDPIADILKARGLPIVYASGHDPSTIAARFGTDAVSVSKPYLPDGLRAALEVALGR